MQLQKLESFHKMVKTAHYYNLYFYVIFSDLKRLFFPSYLMQNGEDGFQDYLGGV